ncbi:phage baseplate protein [Flagellimonas eckloniae]|uniref:phage baseplate protein n=1 Tax=Flagellimonas eckloniae TaxID=346185 RepID=UPI0006DC53FF|nr:tail fiber protein [Allomuricauda eckloniae]
MDKFIAQGDGFPGDNEFLMLIQSMIGTVAQLASVGGENYILKGCVDTAGVVSDGWMVLNGEIVRFIGGPVGAEVTIIETIEQATYLEDVSPVDGQGDSKDTYFTRTAQFGNTGEATMDWADLKRLETILELQSAKMPIGGIIMWAGAIADIPDGWALCDGSNGTPDLSGRFIVGYDSGDDDYDIGDTGGEKEHTLTESEMPAHNHDGSTNSAGSHSHNATVYRTNGSNTTQSGIGGATDLDTPRTGTTNSAGAHTHSITTNNKGGGQPHENRPPFFTLAMIQFKGV